MARKISGERSLKVGGKTYTLRLSFDALEEIEDKYGSIVDLFNTNKSMRLSVIYFLFAKMANVDPQQAMSICNQGDLGDVSELIGEVMAATLNPEGKSGDKKAGNAKARKG